jgi:hypothetical protein
MMQEVIQTDFFLYRPEEEETNYLLAMPCFDKFSKLSTPRIEKTELPYQEGAIKEYYHLPEGDGPFPAIVFTQGNEGVYVFDWYADRLKLSPQVTGERIEYESVLRMST